MFVIKEAGFKQCLFYSSGTHASIYKFADFDFCFFKCINVAIVYNLILNTNS